MRSKFDAYSPKYQRIFTYQRHGHDITAYWILGPYIHTRRQKCTVCHWVGFWYHFNNTSLPHYCYRCSDKLLTMWRGKYWDDTEELPF